MFRTLLRALIVLVLVVAAAAYFLGYRSGNRPDDAVQRTEPAAGTSGSGGAEAPVIDTDRARQAGAQVGEKVAVAANTAKGVVEDGVLTTKIKSKMALDDTVKALNIDVDTRDGVVTLSGVVRSETERQKAVQLSKETDGVKSVVDKLSIRSRSEEQD